MMLYSDPVDFSSAQHDALCRLQLRYRLISTAKSNYCLFGIQALLELIDSHAQYASLIVVTDTASHHHLDKDVSFPNELGLEF